MASLTADHRSRLHYELNYLAQSGVTNLRIFAGPQGEDPENPFDEIFPSFQNSPHIFSEQVFEGFDFLLTEMKKHNMKAVVSLLNYESWAGGFEKYLQWAGEDTQDLDKFYTSESVFEIYETLIDNIVNRKNSISGKFYKEDATIMAWQLSNELRSQN